MKSVIIILGILFCQGILYSQQNIVPKSYELTGIAYTQADSILDVWFKTEYPVILKQNKLKMTCAKCTSIFMDAIFLIDSDGTFVDYEVVTTNKCGQEFSDDLQGAFVFFFARMKFPPSLRNMRIQFRLGTGLKC